MKKQVKTAIQQLEERHRKKTLETVRHLKLLRQLPRDIPEPPTISNISQPGPPRRA